MAKYCVCKIHRDLFCGGADKIPSPKSGRAETTCGPPCLKNGGPRCRLLCSRVILYSPTVSHRLPVTFLLKEKKLPTTRLTMICSLMPQMTKIFYILHAIMLVNFFPLLPLKTTLTHTMVYSQPPSCPSHHSPSFTR